MHKINWNIPSAGIGYYCHKLHQNNGYISEAITALIFYGFHQLGLRRIAIICDDDNVKSAYIAEKLGFMLESKAKGLIPKPSTDELRVSRCYVMFNTNGLEKHKVEWQTDFIFIFIKHKLSKINKLCKQTSIDC
ncbi:hypothetical protein NF27_CG01770 [Candidatus Jidaibacter acanthamoeba]|uniref:N-acetyltransferase domain-containing protein n=1 Tax=Candidatus Jidaibacter acanthamoebae TaxID=86105 RepID=A0A0C1MV45_9RICK|nr:GNAT family protein [Candidatus Jidaibacter acanthamoeba]KIE05997.1 hypothetical protein NF27_CG01770 [Candidatus Jidaibacter acanthamoeba]